ncbi:MAG: hypothetical protein M1132_06575 [Chloroflexi bacterium]|nr:hypothetical protein [Chloroflexota bacterium]
MKLPIEEARLFFKLYFALLAFANRELKVVEDVSKAGDIGKVSVEQTHKIREALFKHPQWLDRFAEENPEGFSPEELTIIRSWKHRVMGDFYLMRYLKKYGVFMSSRESSHLYGVLGLYDPFETVIGGQPLPVALRTTLLPFKGHIIWDGIVTTYTVLFGPGFRADLNATYRRLKEREEIIEQLVNPERKPETRTSLKSHAGKPPPDWKPTIADIVAQTDKMRRADTPDQTAALALLRAAAQAALAAFDETSETGNELRQVRRALTRLENLRYEEDF